KDQNYSDRAGWKEIVVDTASGVSVLSSSAQKRDRSGELSDYPTDLLNNPPQDLEARVSLTSITKPKPLTLAAETTSITHRRDSLPPTTQFKKETERVSTTGTSTAVQLQANRQPTPRNSFTELMATKQLGFGMILVALAVAAGLGAFHALEP